MSLTSTLPLLETLIKSNIARSHLIVDGEIQCRTQTAPCPCIAEYLKTKHAMMTKQPSDHVSLSIMQDDTVHDHRFKSNGADSLRDEMMDSTAISLPAATNAELEDKLYSLDMNALADKYCVVKPLLDATYVYVTEESSRSATRLEKDEMEKFLRHRVAIVMYLVYEYEHLLIPIAYSLSQDTKQACQQAVIDMQ